MIRVRNLTKSFDGGASYAVRDVSFEVADGETFVLLGSSGCGKTTTLKMINRLVSPTAGTAEIDDRDVLDQDPVMLRRGIGYVFQEIGLFPHMNVEANVGIVLRLMGVARREIRRRARDVMALVGLEPGHVAGRLPRELSGGQQQRVGVARALAADPKHLLMDEPFGALDALTRDTLQQEIIKIRRRVKKTIVFVTHDIFEALILGDRIGVMHKGRLEQQGTPADLIQHPATPFVRELFGKPARQLRLFSEAGQA